MKIFKSQRIGFNSGQQQIRVDDILIDVVRKDIKHVHLCIYPPHGRVRVSAPLHMSLETVRVFIIAKLDWIKKHQTRLRDQEREARREYTNRERHYYLGRRHLLKISEHAKFSGVILKQDTIELCFRSAASKEKAREMLDNWYRQRLKKIIPEYIHKWEKVLNVRVKEFGIKRMKTRWGTCNRRAGRIWLNLELAKKSVDCIEYIVVHEMVHFLAGKHDHVFKSYMDQFLPKWRLCRKELNASPLRRETLI